LIIAAKGGKATLDACLKSAVSIEYPDYEVILVDDGLDEIARAIADSYRTQIRIIKNTRAGPSAARNLGARSGDGGYVAFIDSDCTIHPECLSEFMRAFENYPHAAACGGMQAVPHDASPLQRAVHRFLSLAGVLTDYVRTAQKRTIRPVAHNASCNVVYRRDIFLGYGGFAEDLWPGEDVELDYRLAKDGHTLIWNSQAKVYHYRVDSLLSFMKMMFRYGRAQGILVRRYGPFRRIHYVPFGIAAAVVVMWRQARTHASSFAVFFAAAAVGLVVLLRGDIRAAALSFAGPPCWLAGFLRGIVQG